MIDYRLSVLFLKSNQTIYFNDFKKKIDMKEGDIKKEINKFNTVALDLFNCKILIENNRFIIPNKIQAKWIDVFFNQKKEELFFSGVERESIIFLFIFAEQTDLSVFYFQELLQVSKNTILKDIKRLRSSLAPKSINLNYSRKTGFFLTGEEKNIRVAAYYILGILILQPSGRRLLFEATTKKSNDYYYTIRTNFFLAINQCNLTFVPSRFDEMVYYLSFLICRAEKHETHLDDFDKTFLRELNAYKSSEFFCSNFLSINNVASEIYFITILFMTITQGEIQDTSLEFLLEYSSKIIHEIERLAVIQFQNYRDILLNLFYHLVPAFFRIKYQFPLHNVLIDSIKIQYGELFQLTKVALLPLKELTKRDIPDEEIGYFTILFGGEINKQRNNKETILKALILCPSGISSSLIMKSELQNLFPQIQFSESNSIETFKSQNSDNRFDLIFSNIPIKTDKKLYVINTIMTQIEKNSLIQKVQKDFLFSNIYIPSINEIFDILSPYINIKNGMSKMELYSILEKKINKKISRKDEFRPMLSELLTVDMIQFSDKAMSWEEAISCSAQPLLHTKKIQESYIEAMIEKVNNYGPFINIGDRIALPHARPEDGVLQLGMSLLKLNSPVLLSNDEKHPVTIFICLAAIDNDMHLKALASLTKILSNKNKLQLLLNAESKNEIIEIISEGDE